MKVTNFIYAVGLLYCANSTAQTSCYSIKLASAIKSFNAGNYPEAMDKFRIASGCPDANKTEVAGWIQKSAIAATDADGDGVANTADKCPHRRGPRSNNGCPLPAVLNGYHSNVKYEEGTYSGYFVNGKFQGTGTFYYNNGDKYSGDWEDDDKNGKGVYTWSDGDRYEGDEKNGMAEGYGTYYYYDGRKYTGEFSGGNFNGKGTLTWPNGDKYTGSFTDDEQNGYGVFYYSDGRKYEGDWKNDNKEGKGTFTWTDGDRYTGDFKNNRMEGQGTYYFKSGNRYEGEMRNENFNGTGTFTWSDGEQYKGEFKDGKRNGYGTQYYTDGRKSSGIWENGTLVKSGFTFSDSFSDNGNKWPVESDTYDDIVVSGGKLSIQGKNDDHSYNSGKTFGIDVSKDFTCYVEAHWIEGVKNSGFGLTFCSNISARLHYCFFISANGSYSISYLQNGEWTDLVAWTSSNAIKQNYQMNALKIEKKSGYMFFYINDVMVKKMVFGNGFGNDFGVRAGGMETVEFDNFELKGDSK